MGDKLDQNHLMEMAMAAINDCHKMGESAYKEYGLATATFAHACATLALVRLLNSMYADNDGALRVVQLR